MFHDDETCWCGVPFECHDLVETHRIADTEHHDQLVLAQTILRDVSGSMLDR